MMTEIERLCQAAYAADDRFRAELIRCYGFETARDQRYRSYHLDPACQAACDAKIDADSAFMAAVQAQRDAEPV